MIRFWRGLYNRFETGVHPRDFLEDILRAKYHHIDQMRKHITFLENVNTFFFKQYSNYSDFLFFFQYLAQKQQQQQQQQQPKENGGEPQKFRPLGSIDLDEIDRPLKVVEQCMQRLVMQHEQNLKDQQQQCIDEDEKSKSSLDTNENRTVDNQVKN